MLIQCLMQATVYRLRQHGIKLPRPQQAVPGNLLLTKGVGSDGVQTFKAQLLSGEGGSLALPSLERATVRRISSNGIVITGIEIIPRRQGVKASSDFWPQTWWCLVPTVALAECWTGLYEDMEHEPGSTGF
jgi:hypothetical protein